VPIQSTTTTEGIVLGYDEGAFLEETHDRMLGHAGVARLVRCGLVELHAWGRSAAGVRTVEVLPLTPGDYGPRH
jgi:hypothetical protein